MIDEKKLIETLETWKGDAVERQNRGLKPVPLLEKVIGEIKRQADEEHDTNN